jgi:hypothetical protein
MTDVATPEAETDTLPGEAEPTQKGLLYEPTGEKHQAGPAVLQVECFADLQDVKVTKKSNGATYELAFEIPLESLVTLIQSGDGHSVDFGQVFVGEGATVKRTAVVRDADGAKRGKIFVLLPQSEIRRAAGRLVTLIAENKAHGKLVLTPMQQSMDLTSRAE